ncbi:MAG TPA: hypothetical protein VL443_07035 [Cyclobacteriaceae bacterium]|jgi:hypothetical protein|nr:hypothetical protein [Cyclobacteriaceae bacterium]
MRAFLVFILVTMFFWCCKDKSKIAHSAMYQDEELEVYNQVLDNLLDSISSSVRQQDTVKQVFYLNDTLSNFGNEFLKVELVDLKFSIAKATRDSRHRFIRMGDSLKLEDKEIFTEEWLAISRVSINESMNKGFFLLKMWCGKLCGAGYNVEIEKIKGKWQIKKRRLMWVS